MLVAIDVPDAGFLHTILCAQQIADRCAKQLVDAEGGVAAVNRPDGRTVAVYTSTPKDARLGAAR
jgi:hypothetical protein